MSSKIIINKKISSFKKKIYVSGDKSISIRCILLASQAIGKSKIFNLLESEDVMNALYCIKKLGINYKKYKNYYEISGLGLRGYNTNKPIVINAGNSGTLARLIMGLLVDCKDKIIIVGDSSLSKRDFSRVANPLRLFGANIALKNNKMPVTIQGSNYLRPINYQENLGSAQCKSAVMLAALKTPGITKIKARKSRDHTELLYKSLKIPIKLKSINNFDYIEIKGITNFNNFIYKVPGDISSCAFFLALTLLSNKSAIIIKDININKSRSGIIRILNKMNAKIIVKNKKKYKGEMIADIVAKSKNNLRAVNCSKEINSSAIDEFLVIFLVAAKSKGISSFKDLGELNKKESPRLDIAVNFLKKIGIKVKRKNNDIKIYGNPKLELTGNYVMKNFRKDHRVFMMSCIAAMTLGGRWTIYDKDSVKTSFPNFFKIIKSLGAKLV